ncbi:MAG: Xaa-Pro peptidase family protein [Thermoleophilia bacterium]
MNSALPRPVAAPADACTARVRRVQSAVAAAGLAALIVSPGPDLRYLTGFDTRLIDRLLCLVLPATGDPSLVVPVVEEAAVAAAPLATAGAAICSWADGDDPYARVAALLPEDGEIAVSDAMLTVQSYWLREAAPRLRQRPASAVLAPFRTRKDADEVAALRAAGAAIDAVHARVPEWLRVGRTEAEVGADIRMGMLAAGHEAPELVIVASGPNAASPHHGVSARTIQDGDAVVVDIGGAMPSGYWSDCTRTYVMGSPSQELVELYAVLEAAQAAGCAAVKAGVPAAAVDAAARDVIVAAGYGPYFTHRTGHGIGLLAHEEPSIRAANEERLDEGMAFSVEPGIYIPGACGARLEDIVVCTADGHEPLNRGSHDLVVLGS